MELQRFFRRNGIRRLVASVFLLFPVSRGGAQSEAPARLEFVASIKPTENEQGLPAAFGPGFHGVYARGETVYGWGTTLEYMILFAYQPIMPNTEILGGPGWMRSAKYDLVAKPSRPASPDRPASLGELRMGLRTVLAERFHLEVHTEDRETNAYVLEVSKSGPRLQETPGPKGEVRASGLFSVSARNATMEQLASHLNIWVLRCPVVDKTGLRGFYDFKLQLQPNLDTGMPGAAEAQPKGIVPGLIDPGIIIAALDKQLGLKLKAQKVPIPIIVVDRAEKPSEN